MNLGVLTSLNETVAENIQKVAEMGFSNCQLKCWDRSFLTDEYADMTRKATEKYGVEITALWCGWDDGIQNWNFYDGPLTLGLVPKAYRADRVKMLLLGSSFAQKIGVNKIITHLGFIPENPATSEYMDLVNIVRYLAGILRDREQKFLFETGQETPVTLRRLIEDVGTGNLGINLDPANLLMYGKANPVDALRVFGPYVMELHGKDGEYPTDVKKLGKETVIGQGLVNFPVLIDELKKLGFDGTITIEREISGEKQIQDILYAKEYLTPLLRKIR